MAKNDILKEMDRVRKEMDKTFKNFLDFPKMKWDNIMKTPLKPTSELKETKDELIVKMGMPGLKKSDINLNVSENAIEVRAHKEEAQQTKKKGVFEKKESYKGFYTAYPLPAKVLPDKSKALYKKGVLEIHLPKAIKGKSMKKLQVK